MRVLLPPSEAKTMGGRGRPLGVGAAPGPHGASPAVPGSLAGARNEVFAALRRLVTDDPGQAARDLLIPNRVAAAALAANAAVTATPTTPALRRYCGVIYEGLGYSELSTDAQRVARRDTLIFSGLLGVVRGGENVPHYRVPANARLPGVGVLATFWRQRLDALLPPLLGGGLIVDLRSSDYRAMWRPPARDCARVVSVRVMSPLPGGGYGVISYPSKFAKGRLAAALFTREGAGQSIRAVEDVASTWEEATGQRCAIAANGELELYTDVAGRF